MRYFLLFIFLILTSILHAQSLDSNHNETFLADSALLQDGFSVNTNFNRSNAKNTNYNNLTSTSSISLTIGYLADDYDLRTDNGSSRFKFDGKSSALMLSSKASSLMLSYGTAPAEENEGKIRSIAANLHVGGNAALLRNPFGLPIGAYIPIRFNLGYRNLHLMEGAEDTKNSANIGSLGIGAGLGASFRIPTGSPIVEDNITGFISIVKSVGGMSDFPLNRDNNGLDEGGNISGTRLTQNTDLKIEAKFENLFSGQIGLTVGFTHRWMKWTSEGAEDLGGLLDVITGKQENLNLRGEQILVGLGINW